MHQEMLPGQRIRATYDFKPLDHLFRAEFYIWQEALDRWKTEGMPEDWQERNLFQYDEQGLFATGVDMGWCEPAFVPAFEEELVESCGDHDIIRDTAGRLIKVFHGRRHGFMPEYMKHPVASLGDWDEISLRLNPEDPERIAAAKGKAAAGRAQADAVDGMLSQNLIGGYMYLRALIGPEDLLYMLYDQPEVIHAAMQGWYNLHDSMLKLVQSETWLDEIYMAEDICYNHGLLISPKTFKEFLFPYYKALLDNARARQKVSLGLQIDTDGDCRPAIELYMELGMNRMSPFEVASGCDVVEIGRQYPKLVMSGGIDKRVLAAGKDAIDRHLDYIIPQMLERGGYYPTCDHGVPDDVSFENYMYYRERICALDHR